LDVLKNDKITSDPQNEIYAMELKNTANLTFEVGDELCVLPQNSKTLVEKLIARCGFQKDSAFHLESLDQSFRESLPRWATSPTDLFTCLTNYLDIITVTPTILKFFALHSPSKSDQDALTDLAGPSNASFVRQNMSIMDVLEKFSTVNLKQEDLVIFLGLLKNLQPRYYSISSSPNLSKGIIRITYKLVRYHNSMNIRHQGVCSSYLASRSPKDLISVKVQRSTFHLPVDNQVPIIMIAAGTGISPFIGFTEERIFQKNMGLIGKSVVVYGCSSKAAMVENTLWERGLMDGVLHSVITAFSKETQEKIYVQDQIAAKFDDLWPLIESGACIYSCGDVKVGQAVKEALISSISKKNSWTVNQSSDFIQKLGQEKRYHRSEWGLQENPSKTIARARFRLWVRSIMAMFRFVNLAKNKKKATSGKKDGF